MVHRSSVRWTSPHVVCCMFNNRVECLFSLATCFLVLSCFAASGMFLFPALVGFVLSLLGTCGSHLSPLGWSWSVVSVVGCCSIFFQWQGVYECNSDFLANYKGQESSREGSSMVPRDTSVDGLILRCRVKERTVWYLPCCAVKSRYEHEETIKSKLLSHPRPPQFIKITVQVLFPGLFSEYACEKKTFLIEVCQGGVSSQTCSCFFCIMSV